MDRGFEFRFLGLQGGDIFDLPRRSLKIRSDEICILLFEGVEVGDGCADFLARALECEVWFLSGGGGGDSRSGCWGEVVVMDWFWEGAGFGGCGGIVA